MRATRLALAFALAGASLSLHAQDFSSLEERMSQREFERAGLQKLSAEELAFLNRWLVDKGLTAMPAETVRNDRIGLPAERNAANDEVRSRLLGSFRGWTGNTVFRLENGQVWQQTDGGRLAGVNLDSPEVKIEKSLFGAWYLSVEGYNTRAKVRRLE
ncbi:hypothetical protein [uncultured Aquimonas sp.]|jgi:hypothetical protein|uniref:hypothetical protein n=1 Tax=uncultured Aquimonas sp. TaxID=385483 RepID=UPI000869113B|nr:hypothetical protein [uncultured Aquimonas sp.]ODU45030.1 MAG: hypothetical protein ABS96_16870 [Xanthomonadaceae bacterium SCN 69-123]